jgi:hypothetical protein
MTGDLVKAMRACPQPIVAALDGICVGAGAIVAMASDVRLATPSTKTAFLFTRVGLAGCDMGACAILPRIIGQGRASELLFTGRVMTAEEGERWGFHNRLVGADTLLEKPRRSPAAWRAAPISPTASPRRSSTPNGRSASTWRSRWKRRPRRSAWPPTTSAAPSTPSRRSRRRCSRATDAGPHRPRLALLRAPPREVRGWADDWCAATRVDHDGDVEAECRRLVRSLGETPLLQLVNPYSPLGYSVRSLALVRERLAYHNGLADFAFAMQGLGLGPVVDSGSDAQKLEWGGAVARGEAVAAFALTEPETGSDAANIAMTATRDGAKWRLDGEKSYISNGPIADVMTVFARTGEAEGARGLSAFLVRGDAAGLSVAERIEVIAPHPLARLRFDGVEAELIGAPGEGFAIAMRTLNRFRVTVGAAALGFARGRSTRRSASRPFAGSAPARSPTMR